MGATGGEGFLPPFGAAELHRAENDHIGGDENQEDVTHITPLLRMTKRPRVQVSRQASVSNRNKSHINDQ